SAYLVGSTTSANYPVANARHPSHAGGGTDAFVSKLNAAGSAWIFSTYLGGSAADQALGVSVSLGTAFVVGSTFSSNFPLAFPIQPDPGGNNHSDAFITRFDPSGAAFVYSTYLGGTGNDSATAVASDSSGDAYLVGQTDSPDLPLVQPIVGQESYRGAVDAFVAAVIPSGVRFAYSSYLGGTSEDRGTAIAVGSGQTYVLGSTRSTNFPTVKPILGSLVGAQDAFIVKLPSIDFAAAPGPGAAWLGLLAVALFGISVWLLSGRRPARYRTAR
ncbi:MAG TPA: SBBP repeat-containing protein, partial [Polyangiaceae bacterium]